MARNAGCAFAIVAAISLAGCAAQIEQANYQKAAQIAGNRCSSQYAYGTTEYFRCQDYLLDRYEQRRAMQSAIDAQERAANLNLMATGLSMMQQPRYSPMMTCNSYGTVTNCW